MVAIDYVLKLKQGTKTYHDALERRLAPLLIGAVSTRVYTILLRRLVGFYEPIEERVLEAGGLRALPIDVDRRRKAPLLARDLLHLGITQPELARLPLCEHLPRITGTTEALGCLYVLEGATLGGQVIARNLKRTLHLDENYGCAFFHSYGKDVGRMWKSFQGTLNTYCSFKGVDEEMLVGSARETFVSLDEWLFGEGGAEWLTEQGP